MNLKSLTDSQIEENCRSQLYIVGNNINKNKLQIEEIGDIIPGSVMLQDLARMTNVYMNQNGCEILRRSSEELEALGPDYFKIFFPEEEIIILKAGLMKFIQAGDLSSIYSFFQRVRPNNKSEYKWYFTCSRLLPATDDEAMPGLMHIAVNVNTMNSASRKIRQICEENEYISKNYRKFNMLSKREKEIITCIAAGKSSSDISDLLFISIHTVNNHRKNIIRKLETQTLSQLIQFAIAFDLI